MAIFYMHKIIVFCVFVYLQKNICKIYELTITKYLIFVILYNL